MPASLRRTTYAVVACLFAIGLAPTLGADRNVDLLPGMRLDGTPFLRGFVRSEPRPHTFGISIEEAPGASAAVSGRYFLGSSEIRTHVLLFPTRDALDEWDRNEGRTNPSWGFKLHRGHEASRAVQGGVLGMGRTIRVVNRILIIVYGFQHPEAKRRNPAEFRAALTDRQLGQRVQSVTGELVGRAARLKTNQDGL